MYRHRGRPQVRRVPGEMSGHVMDVRSRRRPRAVPTSTARAAPPRDSSPRLDRRATVREAVAGRATTNVRGSHDGEGRLVRETSSRTGAASIAFELHRTAAGELAALRYPSGHVVTRTHDALGRLTAIVSSAAGLVASFRERYGLTRFRRAELAGGDGWTFDPSTTLWSPPR